MMTPLGPVQSQPAVNRPGFTIPSEFSTVPIILTMYKKKLRNEMLVVCEKEKEEKEREEREREREKERERERERETGGIYLFYC